MISMMYKERSNDDDNDKNNDNNRDNNKFRKILK